MYQLFRDFLQISSDFTIADYCIVSYIGLIVLSFFFDCIFYIFNRLK